MAWTKYNTFKKVQIDYIPILVVLLSWKFIVMAVEMSWKYIPNCLDLFCVDI